MFPEDSCLRVYGVGKDGVSAFTDYGIEQHHHRRKGPPAEPHLPSVAAVFAAC